MAEEKDQYLSRDEAVALLKKSVREWNTYRVEHPDWEPDLRMAKLSEADLSRTNLAHADLREADLRKAKLNGANLSRAGFNEANLRGANLRKANLNRANLSGADLSGANLSGANLHRVDLPGAALHVAALSGAYLRGANLRRADLRGAGLSRAKLFRANLDGCVVGWTIFAAIDLSAARNLDRARHTGPSSIGIDTIIKSKGEIPEVFLRGCGMADEDIAHFRSRLSTPIQFFTCFISYATEDEDFATRIYNDFQAAGIRCWKWTEDAKTGKSLWGEIDQAIRRYDKLVLIASEDSLSSPAVNREIERAIQQEDDRQKRKAEGKYDGDIDVLFPVRVDDYIFKGWEHERKADVIKKVIADAIGWKEDHEKYKKSLDRLIRDLRNEPSEAED